MEIKILGMLALATLLTGCSDPVSIPVGVPGTYVLHTVNGASVPVNSYTDGSIILRDDGTFERRGSYVETSPSSTSEFAYTGTFRIKNGFVYDMTNATNNRLPLPSGRIEGDNLHWCQILPADGCDNLIYLKQPPE